MSSNPIQIELLTEDFYIHKLAPDSDIPHDILRCDNVTISRTTDELSITCPAQIILESNHKSGPWKCFKILGELDFNLVGIIAKISHLLADAKIPIYVVSTYNTDYIYIKKEYLERTQTVFRQSTDISLS